MIADCGCLRGAFHAPAQVAPRLIRRHHSTDMSRPRRDKPWPIPLDTLWDDPEWRRMGFVERGMVAALIQAFWLSSLPPAPARTDDEAWRLLIGAREDEWKAHRKAVLAVWGRYERELRIAWAKRKAWAEKGQEWRERALAAARAEQLIRAQEARVVAVEETRTPQTWRPAVVDSPPVGGSRTWKD